MKIEAPEELATLMRWDFAPSPEQWEAIRAPLEPAVVIAGAGSGKTTLMAARVVYLVATEQECGKRGMPTTQFSRSFTFTRRNVPAL